MKKIKALASILITKIKGLFKKVVAKATATKKDKNGGIVVRVKDISSPESNLKVVMETREKTSKRKANQLAAYKKAIAERKAEAEARGVVFDPHQKEKTNKKPKSKTLRRRANRR